MSRYFVFDILPFPPSLFTIRDGRGGILNCCQEEDIFFIFFSTWELTCPACFLKKILYPCTFRVSLLTSPNKPTPAAKLTGLSDLFCGGFVYGKKR